MKILFLVFIVLATLGSIYPFNFRLSEWDFFQISEFLSSISIAASPGDILGNVILFIPIGFTGVLAASKQTHSIRKFLGVLAAATIIALVLQVLQILLPSRDENLQDVVWNSIGATCGIALAQFVSRFRDPTGQGQLDVGMIPLVLVSSWLAYRLIPFIPSIDFQMIKDSVKPIFLEPIKLIDVLGDVTAWVLIGNLLHKTRRDYSVDAYLPLLIAIVFGLEILIVNNFISSSNIVGALVAIIIWPLAKRFLVFPDRFVIILISISLITTGLDPFEVRRSIESFNWIPFYGFLSGSMYVNAQSALEKVFLYGSLVFLAWESFAGFVRALTLSFLFVLSIELLQTRFVGHTPEITDPLLVVLSALALLALSVREDWYTSRRTPQRKPSVQEGVETRSNVAASDDANTRWIKHRVNLRRSQIEYISKLSQESEVSRSRIIRHIVARALLLPEEGYGSFDGRGNFQQNSESSVDLDEFLIVDDSINDGWSRCTVNFKVDQYDIISKLSQEIGSSVSGTVRQVIVEFMDEFNSNHPDGIS